MNIRDRQAIHHAARSSLADARGDLKRVLLIYLGIISIFTLAASAASVILSNRIADTGGLSNIGLRSVLTTGKSALPILQSVVLMSLELGYCTVTLHISRGEAFSTDTLFGGFRRFLPLMGATLLQGATYAIMALLCVYPCAYIFMLLPVSKPFYAIMLPLMESVTVVDSTLLSSMDEATMLAATQALRPMLWIFAVMFLLLAIPTHYSFRMTTYRLIDHTRPRGMRAVWESRYLMRRNRFALLRLDLHFWWYYALQWLVSAVCYGDVLLPLMGIALPFSDTVSYFLFFVLSLILQFAVYYFALNRVSVTYAVAYNALLPKEQPEEPSPAPANVPWSDQY